MIVRIGSFEFVLTPVDGGDRCVIVVKSDSSEVCIDMTKKQASTLADAIKALSQVS